MYRKTIYHIFYIYIYMHIKSFSLKKELNLEVKFIFFFFFFLLLRAALAAYVGSKARGLIGATSAGLHHSQSHSNTGS